MTSCKSLFDSLISDLKLVESVDEMNALAFGVLSYFGISKTDIVSNKPSGLDYSKLAPIIERLNQQEPLQYILNEAWFCGRKFFVDSSVLIPRPETELLVEEAKKVLSTIARPGRILDIGTGSGCIAISLSLEFPTAHVLGIDVSEKAFEVAKRNARAWNAHLNFQQLDILNELPKGKTFDLIVSNPPYISAKEKSTLPKNVLNHEPHLALFASQTDPLVFYRTIAKASGKLLAPNGALLVEINERFAEEVVKIFHGAGLTETQIVKDLNGKDRIVITQIG